MKLYLWTVVKILNYKKFLLDAYAADIKIWENNTEVFLQFQFDFSNRSSA